MVGIQKIYLLELKFGSRSDFAIQPPETSFGNAAREIGRKNLDSYALGVQGMSETTINYINMVHRQIGIGNRIDVTA